MSIVTEMGHLVSRQWRSAITPHCRNNVDVILPLTEADLDVAFLPGGRKIGLNAIIAATRLRKVRSDL